MMPPLRSAALVIVSSAWLAGCASTPVLPPAHPASATAPAGRLAGVAPSLRASVVSYPDVPALRSAPPADHDHTHHHPDHAE